MAYLERLMFTSKGFTCNRIMSVKAIFSTMASDGIVLKVGVAWHLVIGVLVPTAVLAQYPCLCNHHPQRTVYATSTGNGMPIGYLYQDECKELIQRSSDQTWAAVAYSHQVGYVKVDYHTTIMTCSGQSSPDDKLTTTTVSTTSSTSKPSKSTAPKQSSSTVATTTNPQITTSSFNLLSTTNQKQTTKSPSSSQVFTGPIASTVSQAVSTPKPTTAALFSTRPQSTSTVPVTFVPTHPFATSAPVIVSGNANLCLGRLPSHTFLPGTAIGQYGTKCYELFPNTALSWLDGERTCQSRSGHLVSIGSAEEQKYLLDFLVTHYAQYATWIGLNDIKNEGYDMWSSGGDVKYTNIQHMPYDPLYHTIQDCAVIVSPGGQWVYRQCPERHGIVCQFHISETAGIIG